MKKKVREKGDMEERPVKKSIRDISLSLKILNAIIIAKETAKKKAKQQLQFEREKCYMQQTATQFVL